MIGVLLAQWADLATYLLAVSIRPEGESGVLAGVSPLGVVLAKTVGVAIVVVMARYLHGRRRRGLLAFALVMGLIGSLTNVVGGLV